MTTMTDSTTKPPTDYPCVIDGRKGRCGHKVCVPICTHGVGEPYRCQLHNAAGCPLCSMDGPPPTDETEPPPGYDVMRGDGDTGVLAAMAAWDHYNAIEDLVSKLAQVKSQRVRDLGAAERRTVGYADAMDEARRERDQLAASRRVFADKLDAERKLADQLAEALRSKGAHCCYGFIPDAEGHTTDCALAAYDRARSNGGRGVMDKERQERTLEKRLAEVGRAEPKKLKEHSATWGFYVGYRLGCRDGASANDVRIATLEQALRDIDAKTCAADLLVAVRRHPDRDSDYIPRVHIRDDGASCWECCNDDRPCDDDSHWRRGAFAISLDRCPWCDGTGTPNEKMRNRLRDDRRAFTPDAETKP